MCLKIQCDGESGKFYKIFWELNKAQVDDPLAAQPQRGVETGDWRGREGGRRARDGGDDSGAVEWRPPRPHVSLRSAACAADADADAAAPDAHCP